MIERYDCSSIARRHQSSPQHALQRPAANVDPASNAAPRTVQQASSTKAHTGAVLAARRRSGRQASWTSARLDEGLQHGVWSI